MSDQREWSLDRLLSELHELKERLGQLIPQEEAALDRVTLMPVEFNRRWWSSRVDVLVQKIKGDYEKYQAQAQEAALYAKFMTVMADIALETGGMEPLPPPDSLKIGISISASGKIEPTWLDDPARQSNMLYITFEHFEETGQRLKRKIRNGRIIPKNEEEIPHLIFALASQPPEKSHRE